MTKIVIIGAGNIGSFAAEWLASTKDYTVTIIDQNPDALARLAPIEGVTPYRLP